MNAPIYKRGDVAIAYGRCRCVILGAVEDENDVQWFYGVQYENGLKRIVGEAQLAPPQPEDDTED